MTIPAREIRLSEATTHVLGRLQIRAWILDVLARECSEKKPTNGLETLQEARSMFGHAIDNRDFYSLRRHAWMEVLGRRATGSSPSVGGKSEQGTLTQCEIRLLARRSREIGRAEAVGSHYPFSFVALVSDELCDVVGSLLIVDTRARLVCDGIRRPEIVVFPVDRSNNKFSRTFSVREKGEFWLAEGGRRRRAWSSREAADLSVDAEMQRRWPGRTLDLFAHKHRPGSEGGPDLQAETYQLAAFPDPAQVDPERAAAERVDPDDALDAQQHLQDLGIEIPFDEILERQRLSRERWWADRVQDAKKAGRPLESLVEIRLKPDAPATILQALLEALGGLNPYTSTDEDGYIVVTAS